METDFKVRCFDADLAPGEYRALPKLPLYFILDNLRSAFNVGAFFRLSDTLRVAGLFLCGYTASPPHHKLAKTSMGTIEYVPWKKYSSTKEAVLALKESGITVVAAETAQTAVAFDAYSYPENGLAIVMGNEALGVSADILPLCDAIISIPHFGLKNSLNVASAGAVIGYTVLAQWRTNKKGCFPFKETTL